MQIVHGGAVMIIIIADVDEVAALLDMDEARQPEIVRPQTSGPCVHYGPYGCEVPREDGQCPHLDNASIVCPIKDVLGAAQAYAPAEPEFVEPEPDDGALHTYTVPATRKPHPSAWSDEEEEVIRRAQSADEAGRLYSETYGIWKRSRSAVTSRWYKLRAAGKLIAPTPTPDFVGDTAPVTQCDEAAIRRPRFKAGDRVRILHPTYKGYTGTIRGYDAATANYLTHIDGTTDTMWLSEEYLEAGEWR
jgi:hypothetical protein